MNTYIILLFLIGAAFPIRGQTIHDHVEYLAGPELRGRLTGSLDEKKAADYIIKHLESIGAKPLPGQEDFRIPFPFVVGQTDFGSSIHLISGEAEAPVDVTPQCVPAHVSGTGKTTGEVVIISFDLEYDYAEPPVEMMLRENDVRGKTVVFLGLGQKDIYDPARPRFQVLGNIGDWADLSADQGAAALLIHAPCLFLKDGSPPTWLVNQRATPAQLPAIFVNDQMVRLLLKNTPDPEEAKQQFEKNQLLREEIVFLENNLVETDIRLIRSMGRGTNVIGYLPVNGDTESLANAVMLGAHYDHLGDLSVMKFGGSRRYGEIHPGADDNASGTAAVMEIGKRLSDEPTTRPVILAFWSGEELGLVGSKEFVRAPAMDLSNISVYFNFDMVGRLRKTLLINIYPYNERFLSAVRAAVTPGEFLLRIGEHQRTSTDSNSFHGADVPSISFSTDSHALYHTPADTPDTLNYEGINRVVELALSVCRSLP